MQAKCQDKRGKTVLSWQQHAQRIAKRGGGLTSAFSRRRCAALRGAAEAQTVNQRHATTLWFKEKNIC